MVTEEELERPSAFSMSIHTGMLKALGVNMYSNVAKCLVEFIANGYDSDAENVKITIPFEKITTARAEARKVAKLEVEAGTREKFTVLTVPLDESLKVTVWDDGHGMTPLEIQEKFLAINRDRRQHSNVHTPKGRYVMGRKGLGKLAGFGAAELITIRTKIKHQDFETIFTMDQVRIANLDTLSNAEFEPEYRTVSQVDIDTQYTEITLSRLLCDSMQQRERTVRNTIAHNFSILKDDDFTIHLNDEPIATEDITYAFKYPMDDDCNDDGFAESTVEVDEDLKFPIQYRVLFRHRKGDPEAGGTQSLPAWQRGARIYCNNRLAKGPSLLNLHSGMHNFHSQSYLECIVHADAVDQSEVDFIGTNRKDFRSDNEVIESLENCVTNLMADGLKAHAKFIEVKDDQDIAKDTHAKLVLKQAEFQSDEAQKAAKKILRSLAREEGVTSKLFQETAESLIQTMNTGEVFIRLSELTTNPNSIPQLAHELAELRRIEIRDVLKLYKGRVTAISVLEKLYEKGVDEPGKGFENELQDLLKENPWLLDQRYDGALTSDKPMAHVLKTLTKMLQIDNHAAEGADTDAKRPDLVFLLQLGVESATEVIIYELKSPGITLNYEHLTQLKGYQLAVSRHLIAQGSQAKVTGFLVGKPPEEPTKIATENLLISELNKLGPGADWGLIPISGLVSNARQRHLSVAKALKSEDEQLAQALG